VKVTLRTFANLRAYAPAGRSAAEVMLADGATVADLLAALRIPKSVEAVLLVNGRRADTATRLNEGDEATLFPPMEGG
jgi:molybdopterin converting factor small subunit